MVPTSTAPRRAPKQERSRLIVDAVVQAGRKILEAEGADALTTNHIAERAGVSIGSLYRYFPNKEAIIAAICDREIGREVAEIRAADRWQIDDLPLHEALARIVDFQIERHLRLIALGEDVYRANQGEFALAKRLGPDQVVDRIHALLRRHRDAVRIRQLDHGAYLIALGLSAIVRRALQDQPDKLSDPAFRAELVDLAVCYVTAPR